MPRLLVAAVAARLPGWAEEACAEYLARLPREFAAERLAVKPEPRPEGKSVPQILAARFGGSADFSFTSLPPQISSRL